MAKFPRRYEYVAPFMGAWIETTKSRSALDHCFVAPFMGAWIETSHLSHLPVKITVAPFMGAWIETKFIINRNSAIPGRTLHGCVD